MRTAIFVLLVILAISIAGAEDLTGCWVIRQNQGQVTISRVDGCYRFEKESFHRGELTTQTGVIHCEGVRGTITYKNGNKTRVKRTGDNTLCENNIEDWLRVSQSAVPQKFNVSGTWITDGGEVTFIQKDSKISGEKYTRGKLASKYDGVIKGHMISLREQHVSTKRSDSYQRMAVIDNNRILLYFGWTGDTYLTRQ